MLFAKNESNQIVSAQQAHRKAFYICPYCRSQVILKSGAVTIPHFAHLKKRNIACNNVETIEHHDVKYMIASHFKGTGHHVQIEPFIKKCHQYPDLIINQKFAIEVQFSKITIQNIKKRSQGLISCGLKVIWITKGIQYNDKTKILKLNKYERTYIDVLNQQLFVWDSATMQLFKYHIIQFLGGSNYIALREIVDYQLIDDLFKRNLPEIEFKNLKLTSQAIQQYLKRCRSSHSVLEPSLSVIYNYRLSESWVCSHLGIVYPEQLYIQSHPVYWQLQLIKMIRTQDTDTEQLSKVFKFNQFYAYEVDAFDIACTLFKKFKNSYRLMGCNDVQN